MTDTLAPRAIVGVMTPAMNTVVQPELESLRPAGVTNQMQRFRLGGDRISEDLHDEAHKLMDCNPLAIAVGLTTDAAAGGVDAVVQCAWILSLAWKTASFSRLSHRFLSVFGFLLVGIKFRVGSQARLRGGVGLNHGGHFGLDGDG